MKYRKLGKNGPEISVIGFGSWAIGGGGWASAWGFQDDELSVESVRVAMDIGINFYDTAAVYGLGHSEEVIGKALKGDRDKVVPTIPFSAKRKRRCVVSEPTISICTKCTGRIRIRMLPRKRLCAPWISSYMTAKCVM